MVRIFGFKWYGSSKTALGGEGPLKPIQSNPPAMSRDIFNHSHGQTGHQRLQGWGITHLSGHSGLPSPAPAPCHGEERGWCGPEALAARRRSSHRAPLTEGLIYHLQVPLGPHSQTHLEPAERSARHPRNELPLPRTKACIGEIWVGWVCLLVFFFPPVFSDGEIQVLASSFSFTCDCFMPGQTAQRLNKQGLGTSSLAGGRI